MVMSAPMREGSRLDDLAPVLADGPAQPVIATERFTLRPLRASDAGLIEHYTADRRVAEGTRAIPHPLPAAPPRVSSPAPWPRIGPRMSGPSTGRTTSWPSCWASCR